MGRSSQAEKSVSHPHLVSGRGQQEIIVDWKVFQEPPTTEAIAGRALRSTLRLPADVPQGFVERLPQVPGCPAKSEQIHGMRQMRPLSRNFPSFTQGDLERTGTVASDF